MLRSVLVFISFSGALAGVLVRIGENIRSPSVGIGKVSKVHLYSELAAFRVPAFLLVGTVGGASLDTWLLER